MGLVPLSDTMLFDKVTLRELRRTGSYPEGYPGLLSSQKSQTTSEAPPHLEDCPTVSNV